MILSKTRVLYMRYVIAWHALANFVSYVGSVRCIHMCDWKLRLSRRRMHTMPNADMEQCT
jgi:hypothetical protein